MIVSETTLREAALQLLASSSIKRYVREAGRLAVESGLVQLLRDRSDTRAEAQSRAAELLATLHADRERSAAEFELAILLSAFARAGDTDVANLLRQASGTPSAWIRSLAHRCLELGPPTAEEVTELEARLSDVLAGEVGIAVPLNAADRGSRHEFPRAA